MSHTYNVHIIHHRSKNKESAAKWGLKVWGAFHANKHHVALCAAGWVEGRDRARERERDRMGGLVVQGWGLAGVEDSELN